MAINDRIPPMVGMLAEPPRLVLAEDGKIDAALVTRLNTYLQAVTFVLNGRLTFGEMLQGTWTGNFDGQLIIIAATPNPANTEFEVPHGLGRVPTGYFQCRQGSAAMLYDDDQSAGKWTETKIFLKCNVASAKVAFVLF